MKKLHYILVGLLLALILGYLYQVNSLKEGQEGRGDNMPNISQTLGANRDRGPYDPNLVTSEPNMVDPLDYRNFGSGRGGVGSDQEGGPAFPRYGEDLDYNNGQGRDGEYNQRAAEEWLAENRGEAYNDAIQQQRNRGRNVGSELDNYYEPALDALGNPYFRRYSGGEDDGYGGPFDPLTVQNTPGRILNGTQWEPEDIQAGYNAVANSTGEGQEFANGDLRADAASQIFNEAAVQSRRDREQRIYEEDDGSTVYEPVGDDGGFGSDSDSDDGDGGFDFGTLARQSNILDTTGVQRGDSFGSDSDRSDGTDYELPVRSLAEMQDRAANINFDPPSVGIPRDVADNVPTLPNEGAVDFQDAPGGGLFGRQTAVGPPVSDDEDLVGDFGGD